MNTNDNTQIIEDEATDMEPMVMDETEVITVQKKLKKDKEDKILFGVCSGIAKYLGWSPWRVRILLILLTLFGGGGVLAYILLALDMPKATLEDTSIQLEEAHAM